MASSSSSPSKNLPTSTKPHPPQSQPETPTKRVTLKLTVQDHDLASGKYRRPAKSTKSSKSTTITTTKRKSTPGPRTKRGRPKKPRANLPANSDMFGDDEDGERGREEEEEPQGLSMSDFRPLSLLTFPVLVPSSSLSGQQPQPEPQDVKPVKRCAACGVPAPPVISESTPGNQEAPHITTIQHYRPRPQRPLQSDTVIHRSGVRSGGNFEFPSSEAFWYDMAVAEMAQRSVDLDFKMLCLNLIRWKAESDDSVVVRGYARWLRDRSGDTANMTDFMGWDRVVEETMLVARAKMKERREKNKECATAVRCAAWERRMRCRSRGRFVRDLKGAWAVREPGLDGIVRKVLLLGYKRLGRPHEVVDGGEEDGPGAQLEESRGRRIGD